MLTKQEIEKLIEGIRAGVINVKSLPETLYLEIFEQLEKNLMIGLDMETVREISPRKMLTTYGQLSNNLRNFAAHKTYQVINSIIRQTSIPEMQDKYKLYMKTWQKTENDLVVKQSMTVNDWYVYDSQKDIMPYLKYVTAEDERVRDEHVALNGIIKKVDDPFWNEFMPANGYKCRCTVEQHDVAKVSVLTPQEMSTHRKGVDLKFRNNPAKTGYVFKEEGKDKHPYFKVPKEAKKGISGLVKK